MLFWQQMSFLEQFTPCHAQCVRWNEEEMEEKELPVLPVLSKEPFREPRGFFRLQEHLGCIRTAHRPWNFTHRLCVSHSWVLPYPQWNLTSDCKRRRLRDGDEHFMKSHVWQLSWISSRSLLRKHWGCLEPGYLPVFPGRFCNFLGTKFRQGWMVTDIHSGSPLGCVFANWPGCSTGTPGAWTPLGLDKESWFGTGNILRCDLRSAISLLSSAWWFGTPGWANAPVYLYPSVPNPQLLMQQPTGPIACPILPGAHSLDHRNSAGEPALPWGTTQTPGWDPSMRRDGPPKLCLTGTCSSFLIPENCASLGHASGAATMELES